MNKPPGVRLRFCGSNLREGFLSELLRFLKTCARNKLILGHEFGCYSEETYQFGGEKGLEIAHEFHDYDSRAIIELMSMKKGMNPKIFSLMVLSDLFQKVTLDKFEVWDIWCNMRMTERGLGIQPEELVKIMKRSSGDISLVRRISLTPKKLIKNFARSDASRIYRYWENNSIIAEKLKKAESGGHLLYGVRKILPFWVIFHWNRLGFNMSTQHSLTLYEQAALDPKLQ